MAHEEVDHRTRPAVQTERRGKRRGLFLGGAIALVLIAGTLAWLGLRETPFEASLADGPVEDARPTGAGTVPDGEADEVTEGLLNETTRGDFLEPTAPTEAFPNPLLEAPVVDAPTVPSIEDLDPGPGVDDEVLERMTPETGDASATTAEDP